MRAEKVNLIGKLEGEGLVGYSTYTDFSEIPWMRILLSIGS